MLDIEQGAPALPTISETYAALTLVRLAPRGANACAIGRK
jgi:hypothetical protein